MRHRSVLYSMILVVLPLMVFLGLLLFPSCARDEISLNLSVPKSNVYDTLESMSTALPADGASTTILAMTVTDIYSQSVQEDTIVTLTTSLGLLSPALSGTPGTILLSQYLH